MKMFIISTLYKFITEIEQLIYIGRMTNALTVEHLVVESHKWATFGCDQMSQMWLVVEIGLAHFHDSTFGSSDAIFIIWPECGLHFSTKSGWWCWLIHNEWADFLPYAPASFSFFLSNTQCLSI